MRTLQVRVEVEVMDLDDLHAALSDLMDALPAGFRVGPWQVSESLEDRI